jgi:hypothetical protein
LRKLLDAKRNRKSEQLSADQLALFTELLQARQAQAESPVKGAAPMTMPPAEPAMRLRRREQVAGKPLSKNLLRERIVHNHYCPN